MFCKKKYLLVYRKYLQGSPAPDVTDDSCWVSGRTEQEARKKAAAKFGEYTRL